jgi:hypothetical protein
MPSPWRAARPSCGMSTASRRRTIDGTPYNCYCSSENSASATGEIVRFAGLRLMLLFYGAWVPFAVRAQSCQQCSGSPGFACSEGSQITCQNGELLSLAEPGISELGFYYCKRGARRHNRVVARRPQRKRRPRAALMLPITRRLISVCSYQAERATFQVGLSASTPERKARIRAGVRTSILSWFPNFPWSVRPNRRSLQITPFKIGSAGFRLP